MSKQITICLIFFFCFIIQNYEANAQQSIQYHPDPQNVKVVNEAGDTLKYPWAGGMENAQFSSIELNGDNNPDLFVFDRAVNKVSTYIHQGNGNYIHAPGYESFFPQLEGWAFLVDYNRDGRPDIFSYYNASIKVHKNESTPGNLRFTEIAEELFYMPDDYGIFSSSADIPCIKDLDGDGDIDIMVVNIFQLYIHYFKNMSFETFGTNYARYDEMPFRLVDECWGRFQLEIDHPDDPDFGTRLPRLQRSCNIPPVMKAANSNKGNSFSLFAIDIDDDGDNDLVIGEYYSSRLQLLRNGRRQNGITVLPYDSIIAADTVFPANTVRTNVPFYPAPFHVDVDNDGRRDLLIAPQYQLGSANINQVHYYKNVGTERRPSFLYMQNDFLQKDQVDVGRAAAPAFFDYDGDSLPDLLVATAGDFLETRHRADRLVLFRNEGTAGNPVFKEVNRDFLNVSQLRKSGLVPAFGDLDGDGKPDLLLGNAEGTLLFYKNTTSPGQPATFTLADTFFDKIQVPSYSAPTIADLNRDGKPDLVVGMRNGFLNYYRNTGTATQPAFKHVTDKLGNVRTNAFWYNYSYNPDGTKRDSTISYEPTGLSSPTIADINNDGKWDLITGSFRGRMQVFLNIEDRLLYHYGRDRNNFYNPFRARYEDKIYGSVTHPAVAFLSNDTLPDIMIGNERGGLNLYFPFMEITAVTDSVPDQLVDTFRETRVTQIPHSPITPFKIYPNPATNSIYIEGQGEVVEIELYNVLGQQFFRRQFRHFSGNERIDISHLPKGIYLLRFRNNNEQPQVEQIVRW